MKSSRISTRLIGLAFAGGAATIALLAWLGVSQGTAALLEQQKGALEAIRRSRQIYIESYFGIIREQILNFSQDEMIAEATAAFATAFATAADELGRPAEDGSPALQALRDYYEEEFRGRLELGGQRWRGTERYLPRSPSARALQSVYLAENPHPVGSKQRLDAAPEQFAYDRIHQRYHPLIRDFLESFGYYDIFLFDLQGNLVYSVFKETDFATNFLTGPYRDTNFAEVVRQALAADAPDKVAIRDFAAYEPSYGAPASFIGSPIFAGDEKIGVVAFQMPIDKIDEIMGDVAGLGATGETYLVGSDLLMRSDSRFSDSSTILATRIDTEPARQALAGEAGVGTQLDYRGVEVLSSYGPLEIPGLRWAMLAEMDMEEVTQPARELRNRIVAIGLVIAAVLGPLTFFLLRRVVIAPIHKLVRGADRVGRGDYAARVEIASNDELGELARAFNRMTSSIAREIAERELAERELRGARESADTANRAKSTFLANMSHELRTPLNAILGYSEMLFEDANDEGNEELQSDLSKIHAAGKHLLALINDVLDLSKIEAGKMVVYVETFEVAPLIEEVAATVESLVAKNGNSLRVEIDPTLSTMSADLTKLRQALFNLVSNAAKFTEEGEIGLRAQAEGDDGILLSVSDSGIGIPSEKLELIFEEFSQADESTTRDFGGTGLGLAITRRFCRMMGGDICVESRPGVGSTFTIRLPRHAQAAAPAVQEAAEAPEPHSPLDEGAGRTILVVDDDVDARELLARTLKGFGFDVVTASDGAEALRLAHRLRPSAITLDVVMPSMDGWSVLEALKADPDTREIPVIMVTMTDDRNMGAALGATDFLTKPIERQQLVALLNRHGGEREERSVLVVDDDAGVREWTRRALEREGWSVTEAGNGQVALAQLVETAPSLILLDLMMPVMDGFEFVMEMQKRPEWRSIPIVVVTAKDVSEAERRRLNGDVVSLIQKRGFGRAELLEQVRDLVSHSGSAAEPEAH